jgi:hypothetical protein
MLVVVDGSPCTQRSVIVTAAALESAVSIIVVANPARSRVRLARSEATLGHA